jgi:chemotaxis protein CheY-P-specific phosphatase CheC
MQPEHSIANVLTTLAGSGAERARAALETLLGREIRITGTDARIVDAAEAALAAAEDGTIGRLSISGAVDGNAFVVFPKSSVEDLEATFGLDGDSDDAKSMLGEVANIVASSYISELGDAWQTPLDPSTVALDSGVEEVGAFLQQASASPETQVVVLGCRFTDDAGSYEVSILLVLAHASVVQMVGSR